MHNITRKQISYGAAALIIAIIFPLVITSTAVMHVMILFFMFAIMGVAWNIMGGYAGMFSFGQVAFFGIGAYTSSFLLMTYHVNPWIGLIAGGLVAAVVGAAIGYPCSNLRGHYFAIASIAFGEIVRTHFNNWKLVGAAEGLSLPMLDEGFKNFMFHSSKLPYYYIVLAFLIIALIVCYIVSTSKMGYYFRAIKESHDVAKVLGVNVVWYRLLAIMMSAFLTAMAGTFYAQYVLYIDPESVMLLPVSVQIVLISMLGGAGHAHGARCGRCRPDPHRRGDKDLARPQGNGHRYADLRISHYAHFSLPAQGCVGILLQPGKEGAMKTCLEVRGVTKHFGGLYANDNVDFKVEEGEIVSVIGPNGAGKSTLFNCITGFYPVNSGKVLFFGKDVTRSSAHRICKLGIARTFQVVQVISDMTVLENVMTGALLRYSRINHAVEKAEEILAFTGLIEKKDFLGTQLTIADKKRLEVSMALATQPKLLMLDESMAGLTVVELRGMIELIKRIRKNGMTLVVVEHVMEAVMEISDRVVVLNSGKKIMEGPPGEVVSNKEVIQAYLGEKFNAVCQ